MLRTMQAAATEHAAAGRVVQALPLFETITQIDPDHAAAQYGLGFVLHQQGYLSRAIEHYTTALHHDPENIRYHS